MIDDLIKLIKEMYNGAENIPLYKPATTAQDARYIQQALEERFVASTSPLVEQFEQQLASYTGAQYAVAVQSGTAALHLALKTAGVGMGDLVITQPLSFIATCNAIKYTGADPLFIDVDEYRLCLNVEYLSEFFQFETDCDQHGNCIHKNSGRRIAACLPVHHYGIPGPMDQIKVLCEKNGVTLIEDAAEALGSFHEGQHAGTFGKMGTLSFNGNKIISCGNGGAILTNDKSTAERLRHLSTQAKVPHPYEFVHDAIGYNYRLSAIEAGLGLAQLERFDEIKSKKDAIAAHYHTFFKEKGVHTLQAPPRCEWNYWLAGAVLEDFVERYELLEKCNKSGINARGIWKRINTFPMYSDCISYSMDISTWLQDRVVVLPSWVP